MANITIAIIECIRDNRIAAARSRGKSWLSLSHNRHFLQVIEFSRDKYLPWGSINLHLFDYKVPPSTVAMGKIKIIKAI